ncbi:hypothetical protein WR25_07541 [Diploscapter pachys]|uniref:CX domain-containing protein n=1 Tax=Diploscapter pachys TaxID=2018661 RepID=A0A2A2JK66_9BILA|nr:hypothetical protein WR25_07541 [Diploscapter pachys]
MFNRVLFLVILIASPAISRRSGGTFSSRGFPSQGGGFRPAQPGGFHPQPHPPAGGFRPAAPGGGFSNVRAPPPVSGFRSGKGPGSTHSSSALKHALIGGAIGAVGGILAYEAGKAIIRSATSPFNYNNRPYYWDNHYQGKPGMFECSMRLDTLQKVSETPTTTAAPSTDNATTTVATITTTAANSLGNIQFSDGSKPYRIVWGCRAGSEQCCGTDCCALPQQAAPPSETRQIGVGGFVFAILIILLLIGCCCCLLAYKMCRETLDCILPRDEHKHYEDHQMQHYQTDAYPPQGQAYYPAQPYPSQPVYNPPAQYPNQPYYR